MKDLASDYRAVAALLPDGFSLESTIDVGGQGAVHFGDLNGERCALKVYFPGQLEQRVDREVAALRELDSPSLVRLLWSGEVSIGGERLPVVATEFIEGETLASALESEPVPLGGLSSIAVDVTRAIEVMWARRIVHRDLKPNNIMLRPDGTACVIDLGVARHLDESSLTAIGSTWGTFGYMSPEQTNTVRQLTCKSDLFSLGVILIEAAMGRHPTGKDQLRLLASQFHRSLPEPVRQWEQAELLTRLLNPKPILRPNPTAVIELLEGSSPRTDSES